MYEKIRVILLAIGKAKRIKRDRRPQVLRRSVSRIGECHVQTSVVASSHCRVWHFNTGVVAR
jgi:hypothetical protein